MVKVKSDATPDYRRGFTSFRDGSFSSPKATATFCAMPAPERRATDLGTTIAGVRFPFCAMNASGAAASTASELRALARSATGAIVLKSATVHPFVHPEYRSLHNPGFDKLVPLVRELVEIAACPVIASIVQERADANGFDVGFSESHRLGDRAGVFADPAAVARGVGIARVQRLCQRSGEFDIGAGQLLPAVTNRFCGLVEASHQIANFLSAGIGFRKLG